MDRDAPQALFDDFIVVAGSVGEDSAFVAFFGGGAKDHHGNVGQDGAAQPVGKRDVYSTQLKSQGIVMRGQGLNLRMITSVVDRLQIVGGGGHRRRHSSDKRGHANCCC